MRAHAILTAASDVLTCSQHLESDWDHVQSFLMRTSAEAILRQLRSFKPSSVTLEATVRMRALVEPFKAEQMRSISAAASLLFYWVRSVYAQAQYDMSACSNYAILSPRLANTPYSGLRRYQPPAFPVVPVHAVGHRGQVW
jgi:hypothetical protein